MYCTSKYLLRSIYNTYYEIITVLMSFPITRGAVEDPYESRLSTCMSILIDSIIFMVTFILILVFTFVAIPLLFILFILFIITSIITCCTPIVFINILIKKDFEFRTFNGPMFNECVEEI